MDETSLNPGESILETSARLKTNPWLVASQNNLDQLWQGVPSQPIFFAKDENSPATTDSPIPFLTELSIVSLPLVQGKTVEILGCLVNLACKFPESLLDKDLHFFQKQEGQYVALQGIHAMSQPGLNKFELTIIKPDSSNYEFSQMVYLQAGNYPEDPPLSVDPTTIDPAITKPEDDQIRQVTSANYSSKTLGRQIPRSC